VNGERTSFVAKQLGGKNPVDFPADIDKYGVSRDGNHRALSGLSARRTMVLLFELRQNIRE
jgi:hypothetical protein